VSLAAGELAGTAQALTTLAAMHDRLDSLASTLAAAANGAQTGGVALDGSAGQPLFSGTSAATIAVALSDGAQLATAPAGAGAGSRDPANLDVLRNALASAGVAEQADAMLFAISGMVAGRSTTRDALQLIADTAAIALEAQAGVDLDQEAANLLRFQQAFQASGKAMQVAATLFDTLMEIR
jgi:flagellar hook-associated protein 1 FlgK